MGAYGMRNPQEVEPLLTPPSTPLIDGVEYTSSATDSQNPTASIKSILRSSSNYVAPKQVSVAVDSDVNDSRKLKKSVSWSDLNPGGSLVEIKMVKTEKKSPPKKETHWKGLLCSA